LHKRDDHAQLTDLRCTTCNLTPHDGKSRARPLDPARDADALRLIQSPQSPMQAWHERGVNSDKSTEDKDDDAEEAEDPQADLTLVKARICDDTMNIFKRVLLFSQGAAVALYGNQMINTLDVLQDLTDKIIKELCHAIKKPGGDITRHQIFKLSVTCLKLFAFCARHMWRTLKGVDNRTKTTWNDVKILTNQKTLENSLLDTKYPETPTMTLDPQLAAKAFTNMLILLGKMQGIVGHPLNYVP
jgi:hypothetical protein